MKIDSSIGLPCLNKVVTYLLTYLLTLDSAVVKAHSFARMRDSYLIQCTNTEK